MSKRKKKNNNFKIIIIFFLIIVIAISLFVYEIYSFAKKSKQIKESREQTQAATVEEEKEEPLSFESFLDNKVFEKAQDIENLTDAQIIDLMRNVEPKYTTKYLKFLSSANSTEAAKEVVKNSIKAENNGNFVDKTVIIEEDEIFYGVHADWRTVTEKKTDSNRTNYIVPKKDYFNTAQNTLNMDNYDTAKRMLDLQNYISNTRSKLIQSFFTREDDGCHYVIYYITSLYSEKDNASVYSLVKETSIINSASGLIESTERETLKEVVS